MNDKSPAIRRVHRHVLSPRLCWFIHVPFSFFFLLPPLTSSSGCGSVGGVKRALLIATAVALIAPTSADALPGEKLANAAYPNHCAPVQVVQAEIDPVGFAWAASPLLGHSSCTIYLSDEFAAADFASQCTAVIHEYGHLAGLWHSDDPASIMYPRPRIVPECNPQPRHKRIKRLH